MYKYTVEAYDESDLGKLNGILIVVKAHREDEAIKRAQQIKQRTNYNIVGIEELEQRPLQTGDTRPKIQKG